MSGAGKFQSEAMIHQLKIDNNTLATSSSKPGETTVPEQVLVSA